MDEVAYDYVDDELHKALECPICRNAFVEPTTSPLCQHNFCFDCITRALELSPTCPIDRTPLRQSELKPAPRVVREMVNELKVFCTQRKQGCEIVCERGDLIRHVRDDCAYNENSLRSVRSDPKGKGKEKLIENVQGGTPDGDESVYCEYCAQSMREAEMSSHEKICPDCPIECDYCGLKEPSLTRRNLVQHYSDCLLLPIPCPHAEFGCSARIARGAMTEEHLELGCAFEPIKQFLNKQKFQIETLETENWELKSRVNNLENDFRQFRNEFNSMKFGLGKFVAEPATENIFSPPIPSPFLSANSTSAGFPLLPPASSPSAAVSVTAHSLPATIASIEDSISALAADLNALELQQSAALHSETHRLGDEMGNLRGVVHGLRMQIHYLLMELNRRPFPARNLPRSDEETNLSDGREYSSDEEAGIMSVQPPYAGIRGMYRPGAVPLPLGMRSIPAPGMFPMAGGMKL